MKLNRGESGLRHNPLHAFHSLVHEHANLFHFQGQGGDDGFNRFDLHPPRTLLEEHKAQRIRARGHCCLSVLGVRDSANLDPSHLGASGQ